MGEVSFGALAFAEIGVRNRQRAVWMAWRCGLVVHPRRRCRWLCRVGDVYVLGRLAGAEAGSRRTSYFLHVPGEFA